MADLIQLHRLLGQIEDQLATCMRCGMCQAVCPVYAETGHEALVARGKIALLEHLAHRMISDVHGVKERLGTCLLCGACAANCPSGVRVLDIFLRARAALAAYEGLSPLQRLIFRGLLVHPRLFDAVVAFGARFQGIFVRPVDAIIGSSCTRFPVAVLGARHFPALAGSPLHRTVPDRDTASGTGRPRVAFFPGCLVDKIFPRIGHAVLKVLDHHGIGVFLPQGMACCGIPALAGGDQVGFQALVKKNLDRLGTADFDYLVTPCATCTATIVKFWPSLAAADDTGRAAALAAKTMDINAFLVDIVRIQGVTKAVPARLKVTVHDPCHLKKSLGVAAQPRAVARLNPQVQLVEMKDPDACCGCGGSFSLLHYDLSGRLGRHKRDNITASGADVVATGCPACMLQLTDMLSQAGDRVAVRHPVELYAETLQ